MLKILTGKREYIDKAINLIDTIWDDYKEKYIRLNDRARYNQYQLIQTIKAHQSGAFLTGVETEIPRNKTDEREFRDIVRRTNDTSVANTDFDSEHLDTFTYSEDHEEEEFISKSIFQQYKMNTKIGQLINDFNYRLTDEGNILVRFNPKTKLPKPVNLLNIAVSDTTAEDFEQTDVVENEVISQSELFNRTKDGWVDIKEIIDACNVSKTPEVPRYEVKHFYAELRTDFLNGLREEVYGKGKEKYTTISEHCLIIYIKAKDDVYGDEDVKVKGFVVYAEITPKEVINVTNEVTVERYKPYEFLRLSNYEGRLFGKGHREIGIPHQNKANKIAQRFDKLLDQLKLLYATSDDNLLGKNIVSGFKEGQIIYYKPGTDFKVLNNQFPNLQFLVEQWNSTIQELDKDLKAFEIATGENLPASTSATAVAVSNDQIGKYYNLKREKMGFLWSIMFKRWILKDLLESTKTKEKIEIIGDPVYINEYIEKVAEKAMLPKLVEVALSGQILTPEDYQQLKQIAKDNLAKKPKLFHKMEKDFFKGCELYVGLNVTNENYNKQGKVANGMTLMQYWANPAIKQDPQAKSILEQITREQGFKIPKGQQEQPAEMGAMPQMPGVPLKEPSLQQQAVDNANV